MVLKESAHPPQYWYDGQLCFADTLTLPLTDPAWCYGATVFTTLRVYGHSLRHPWTAWAAHQARIASSLESFAWTTPDWDNLRQGAEVLAQTYPVLRITCFPDGRELISGRSLPPRLGELQALGGVAWLADAAIYSRSLPTHKTGNYLGCWLAMQAARRAGAQEAILINRDNHWLETSTGNLWGWADGCWWTPPLAAGILPGVLRARLMSGIRAQGGSVVTQPWTPEQVPHFNCLAYSNSVVEVVPIRAVLRNARAVDYNPDYEKIQQLKAAWQLADPET